MGKRKPHSRLGIARGMLKSAKEQCENGDASTWINSMHFHRKLAKVSLARIGTSKRKVNNILRKGYKAEAQNLLTSALRDIEKGIEPDHVVIERILEYLEKGECHPNKIGSSLEELYELGVRACGNCPLDILVTRLVEQPSFP